MGNHQSKRKNDIISALAIAAESVHLARAAAPAQPVQGILSVTSGILSIIKNTIKNKEDFRDLIHQCEWIGRLVESYPIIGQDHMAPALVEAMNALDSTVRMTRDSIAGLGRRTIFKRLFTSALDIERIRDMTVQLDRSLNNLKAALHLANTLTLQVQTQAIETAVRVLNTKYENPATASPSIIPSPPPRPAIFCGREDLVTLVCDNLLSFSGAERRHVALLGVGGIGKSSVAKAVLNEPHIQQHFVHRRFFVRFDDILSSQITYATFIDRVARTLGIPVGGDHGLILEDVKNKATLLVLDNGETFLDPEASRDVSRIKIAIDEIGGFPSVSILLTSRSWELPRGLMWEKIEVPSLDPTPAFDLFTRIFRGDVSQSRIMLEEILATADHHPLTITLLAYAVETNSWTIDDLNERWAARRTKVLNIGYGKYENLTDSIEISLGSPCVTAFGENVRRVLGMIAFFPQGILRKSLKATFPSITQITEIVEVLHKQSLIIFTGDFASMLAPIRLHAKDAIPDPDALLLNDIRDHYHGLIHASGVTDRDKESNLLKDQQAKSLILSEDINVEALISFDLQRRPDGLDGARALQACEAFIHCLHSHKPRSTSLRTVVHFLDIGASPAIFSAQLGCLKSLAALAHDRYDFRECIELCTSVQEIASTIGQNDEAICATLFLTGYHLNFGACTIAQKTFECALGMPGWSNTTALNKALACSIQGHLKELTDVQITRATLIDTYYREACRLFQAAGLHANRDVHRALFVLAPALVHGGHQELKVPRAQLKEMTFDYEIEYGTRLPGFLSLLALAAFADQDTKEAKTLLKRARALTLETQFFSFASQILIWLAIVAVAEGKPSDARDLIKQVADEQQKDPSRFSDRTRWYQLYVSGVVELVSGYLPQAWTIFDETKKHCELRGEFYISALSSRAMGEIAHLQGDSNKSRSFFEETVSTCTDAGITPRLLYRYYYASILAKIPPATYEGWPAFLNNTSMS